MIEHLKKFLTKSSVNGFDMLETFSKPVDPRVLPNYYNLIKRPMDLGTVEQRLNNTGVQNAYQAPQAFFDDCMLVWTNGMAFNVNGTMWHRTASAGKSLLEKMWRDSGLAQAVNRARRTNAGVPAKAMYENLEDLNAVQGAGPRRGGGGKSAGGGKRKREESDLVSGSKGGRGGGGGGGAGGVGGEMSNEEIQDLAMRVQELYTMDGMLDVKAELEAAFRRANAINADNEVDFEALDHNHLWELRGILEGMRW